MFFAGRSNVGVEAENHVSGLGQYFHRCLRGTKNQGMCKTYLAGSTTIGTMVITVLSAILSLLLGKLGGGYQKRDETGFWSPIVHQLLLVHQLRIADCHIGQHLHKHTHKLYPVFLTFFFFFSVHTFPNFISPVYMLLRLLLQTSLQGHKLQLLELTYFVQNKHNCFFFFVIFVIFFPLKLSMFSQACRHLQFL